MMLKRIIVLTLLCAFVFILTYIGDVQAENVKWGMNRTYVIEAKTIPVFTNPDINAGARFVLYKGMPVMPSESIDKEGFRWFKINGKYWIPAMEPNGIVNLSLKEDYNPSKITDLYGILDMPHTYAVKLVKFPGATGRIETYKKIDSKYVLQRTYNASYREGGPKAKYGDLKTPGGPVIRYLYRTTHSSMNGWDKNGKSFGVYKVSYPMPHDAFPYLMDGKMGIAQYNNIPAINYKGDILSPHPKGMLGADILIHTKTKGSLGCINIENEEMSYFYNQNLVTENDKEIIPFVIYDENVIAPPVGELF